MKLVLLLLVLLMANFAYWSHRPEITVTPRPEPAVGKPQAEESIPKDVGSELIMVEAPVPGSLVSNPIELSGQARGYWFFEASAPVVVVDWDGRIIGESYVTAVGEWMTEDLVPFTGSIEYELPTDSYSASGTVIFRRDNPSGLPEHDAAVEIPVVLQRMSE